MSVFMVLAGLILLVSGHGKSQLSYQYFTLGDTTSMKCLADGDRVTWNGPALSNTTVHNIYNESNIYGEINEWKTTVYIIDNKTNSELPHTSRLELQNVNGTFMMTIVNTSQEDEGLYVCEATKEGENLNVTFILLQKRRRPSKITFQKKTGGMFLSGRENRSVIITCTENTALPPSHLSLLKNGKILLSNAIGHINYTIIPTKDDINTTFRCTSTNLFWNTTISKDVVIDVQFTPLVKFINKTFKAVEGKGAELCCSAESNPMVQNMTISHDESLLPTTRIGNGICHHFRNLTRINGGNYVCSAQNDVGQGNASTDITIMYPPDVTVSVSTNASDKTSLKCVATGFPENYKYGLWEHHSFFGEHIRYLNSTTGQLVLPSIHQQMKYEDNGCYTCNVSNGIRDFKGNLFQKGSLSFESPGPPFMITGNNRIQYGSKGTNGEIQFDFMSYTPKTCLELNPLERWFVGLFFEYKVFNITAMTIFHNKPVTVRALKVVFVLAHLQQEHFQRYRITVCNKYGNLSFEFNFKQVAHHDNVENTLSAVITVLVPCMLLIVLMVVGGLLVVCRRHNQTRFVDSSIEMADISRYRRVRGHDRSHSPEGSDHPYDYCDVELYHTADHVDEVRINQTPVNLDYEVPVTDNPSLHESAEETDELPGDSTEYIGPQNSTNSNEQAYALHTSNTNNSHLYHSIQEDEPAPP